MIDAPCVKMIVLPDTVQTVGPSRPPHDFTRWGHVDMIVWFLDRAKQERFVEDGIWSCDDVSPVAVRQLIDEICSVQQAL